MSTGPTLDQLMEDLRRIASEGPGPQQRAEPPPEPTVSSLRLSDHGILVAGAVASPIAGAANKTVSAEGEAPRRGGFFSGRRLPLLGGALVVVVVAVGAFVFLRGSASSSSSTSPSASALSGTARASPTRHGSAADDEHQEEEEDAGEERGEESRRVRFAQRVQVREFEKDQAPHVSVKISSDDIL